MQSIAKERVYFDCFQNRTFRLTGQSDTVFSVKSGKRIQIVFIPHSI